MNTEVIYTGKTPCWAGPLTVPVKSDPPLSLPLGDLQSGTRLLACLSGTGITGYQISLSAEGHPSYSLPPIGVYPSMKNKQGSCEWVTGHVDWFELHKNVRDVLLTIDLSDRVLPASAVLHCSQRQKQSSDAFAENARTPLLRVPPLSQMVLPEKVRHSTCAPVSIAMLLQYYGLDVDLAAFIRETRHKPTGLQGVWLQNMLAASQHGLLATVRYFRNLQEIVSLLQLGIPVPVSIRYSEGMLPGSHLPKTKGHLMVITGIDRGQIYINDPAAPTPGEVAVRYDLAAFYRAWQGHHGIGYIMHPVNWPAGKK